MDYFGGRNISSIIGILYAGVAFGTLTGPSAAGFAFDISHSYAVPILASVCANIIAAGIMVVTSKTSTADPRGRGRRKCVGHRMRVRRP